MIGALREASLQLRTAQRVLRRRGSIRSGLSSLEPRAVFVVGCPRSGTTFLGRAIGSLPGFVDLGEVAALKAAIPELAGLEPSVAAARIRRILTVVRRLGMVAGLRAVEQTPETVFVLPAVLAAVPEALVVHIVRDGRDVACSLRERGWLSAGRSGGDDAGLPYGARARFWVEPDREAEFEAASDLRRAAWAWRRYVEAGRAAGGERALELRYERLAEPATAAALADFLGARAGDVETELVRFTDASIGRFRTELDGQEAAEVEDELAPLLRELGYLH